MERDKKKRANRVATLFFFGYDDFLETNYGERWIWTG